MQNWQPRASLVGPASDVWSSTEAHDKASTSSHHDGEDALSKMLPRLSHLDLTGCVSTKDAAMTALGGYSDVFVGNIASEHVRHRCIVSTGAGEVKVAIKRLRVRLRKDEQLAKSLAREMGVRSRLNHRNILPLLGYLLENDYPSLISEWIENGTASDFVKNNPECNITHLALGIAKGLEFMHGRDIVHSNMKADNVLISQSGEPLICGFCISSMLNSSQTFFVSTTHDGSLKGNIRWMAIELLMPDVGADPKHTKETDVWAYGMTLYEIITTQIPYAHLRSGAQVILAISKGKLPTKLTFIDSHYFLMDLWTICTMCWKNDPNDRLTIARIAAQLTFLEGHYQGIAIPPQPTHDKVASTSRQHGGEDILSNMLPELSHLDLTGCISEKDAAMVAHGGYCDVFTGHVQFKHVRHRRTISTGVGEIKVAIRRIRAILKKDEKLPKRLAREMAIWSRLDHPNILPLLGYLLENDYPSLISEWMENGTIRDFMKNNPQCDLTHLALGIAKGLEFLHDHDVVHSDMKPDNILVSQSGKPLICDFGISRMLNPSQTFFISTTHDGTAKGNFRWMAIELLKPSDGADPKHTKETDVWAYGMILYEIISKQVPFADLKGDALVLFAVIKGKLPVRPTIDTQSSLLPLWSVCESCWKADPKDRFTMAQISRELKGPEGGPKV